MRQEALRRRREEDEREHRSKEYALRRCRKELGIEEPRIASAIATSIVAAERDERKEMTALQIYQREINRLRNLVCDASPSEQLELGRRIRDGVRNIGRAQADLDRGQYTRTARLARLINWSRVESARLDGRRFATSVEARIAANDPDPVGTTIPWDVSTIRFGKADEYLTIHNADYPSGADNADIAPYFRHIQMQGEHIEICALEPSHSSWYGEVMESDHTKLLSGKSNLGLLTPRTGPERQTKLPITSRIQHLAAESSHGRGYAFAIKGHEADGPFYGIASYNIVSRTSPRAFFEDPHLDDTECRMVDFSFQFITPSVSDAMSVEVGTLLIEHARVHFGAQLFRSECNPLNTQYSHTMATLGLDTFKSFEPASYNTTLAAATWKFDFCTWKFATSKLKSRKEWYIEHDFLKSPASNSFPSRVENLEPIPDLAVVEIAPTPFDDPVAYELGPSQEVQAAQQAQEAQQASQNTNQTSLYFPGAGVASNSGTTWASHSDTSASNSTASDSHDENSGSSSGSSSGGSRPRSPRGSEPLIIRGHQVVAAAGMAMHRTWQGRDSFRAMKDREDSLAMPPPPLPQTPTMIPVLSQYPASSSSWPTVDNSNASCYSMHMDSGTTPCDRGNEQSVSTTWMDQLDSRQDPAPPQSALYEPTSDESSPDWQYERTRPQSAPCEHAPYEWTCPTERWPSSGACSDQPASNMETVLQVAGLLEPASYGPIGVEASGSSSKRLAPVSWERQPKKRPPLWQSSNLGETNNRSESPNTSLDQVFGTGIESNASPTAVEHFARQGYDSGLGTPTKAQLRPWQL